MAVSTTVPTTHGPIQPACPRCGYDQSGAVAAWVEACPVKGLCTECGARFRWSSVLAPRVDPYPWFFEHAGRWTWPLRVPGTAARCLVPVSYWRAGARGPVRWGRLAAAWLIWWVAVRAFTSATLAPLVVVWASMPSWGTGWWGTVCVLGWQGYLNTACLSFLGTLLPGWPAGWTDFEDHPELLLASVLSLHVAWVWTVAFLVWASQRSPGEIGRGALTGRAWLMSLFVLPLGYEVMRVAAAIPYTPGVVFDASVVQMLWMVILLGWVLVWWLGAARNHRALAAAQWKLGLLGVGSVVGALLAHDALLRAMWG